MSNVIIFQPCSNQGGWLAKLTIKPTVYRLQVCMNKLGKIFNLCRVGDVSAILKLYDFYLNSKQAESLIDIEIARLSKVLKESVKDKMLFEATGVSFRYKISNSVAASFYTLITKFDTLMSIIEMCVVFGIFKKRRTLSLKRELYSKNLMRLIADICQFKLNEPFQEIEMTDITMAKLSAAIQSDIMPIFTKQVYTALQDAVKVDLIS